MWKVTKGQVTKGVGVGSNRTTREEVVLQNLDQNGIKTKCCDFKESMDLRATNSVFWVA